MLSRVLSLELAFFPLSVLFSFLLFLILLILGTQEKEKRKLPSYNDTIHHYYLWKVPHSFLSLIEKHQMEKVNFFEIACKLPGKVTI